ncbi:hypothetical protein [Candidatus Tisiphia endosymbiont of Nemotelus uliginosus]|uniref:hypothetical protein n=1 Tax=Candidatus Tisiphia endosymbiont of Nemotelus uliginosus TaxID=3077926 RepID=UPI0035C8CFCF
MESFRQNKINAEEAASLIQSHCNKGGVELNIRNNVGDTPMHILLQPASVDKEANAPAAERLATSKQKILQKLIAQGADLTIKNNKGQSIVYTPDSRPRYTILTRKKELDHIKQSLRPYQPQRQNGAVTPAPQVTRRQKDKVGKKPIGRGE